MKTLNGNLELIPHIVIDPNDFRTSKRKKVARRDRAKYWVESLAQAGIEGVNQLEKHRWIAPVREVHHNRILLQVLKNRRHEIPKENLTAESLAIWGTEGGVSLFHAGKPIFPAMCCSDLGNINDWKHILDYRESKWTLMWNGHPMIPVRYSEGLLKFADNSDDKPTSKSAAKYGIPVDVLKIAVKQATQEFEQFQNRIYDYWINHQDEIWK